MFTNLQIVNGILRFNWGREPEEYLVVRNKLTKNEYFRKICTDMMRKNGINLIKNRIPKNVPLEVVSRVEGRRDVSYNVANITPYRIYYQLFDESDGTVSMDIVLPGIAEEMGEFIPEDLIYLEMVTPDDARIPLYLPRLRPGYNRFWFTDPGSNCQVRTNNPRLDETVTVCEGDTIKGVFQLIHGEPSEEERRH